MFLLLALLAMVAEVATGYPEPVLRRIGHPVIWMGRLVSFLDRSLNRDPSAGRRAKRNGAAALAILVFVAGMAGAIVQSSLSAIPFGLIFLWVVAGTLIAQRSLHEHVHAVAEALDRGGVAAGRASVSKIVGRDPESLDEAGVCRAAIESLAENFSDGIVAPVFWLAVGGLPAGCAYKAINTADSMIGHRNARYEHFGWASARLDDLVNLPASRISALLIVAAAFVTPGASAKRAWETVRRDARLHRSPNAGWPEAAMAGALGLALAGPRSYGGVLTTDPEMGAGGRREVTSADIRRALRLYRTADAALALLILILTAAVTLHG